MFKNFVSLLPFPVNFQFLPQTSLEEPLVHVNIFIFYFKEGLPLYSLNITGLNWNKTVCIIACSLTLLSHTDILILCNMLIRPSQCFETKRIWNVRAMYISKSQVPFFFRDGTGKGKKDMYNWLLSSVIPPNLKKK